MSPLLIALLGVLLLPLFVGSWRASLAGLGLQGLLLALIAYRLDPHTEGPGAWLRLLDLGVVRGLVAPLALHAVLRGQNTPSRNDVIPPNLLSWTLALAMVVVSFSFAEILVLDPGDERTLVAVTVAGILLGFLVLATQSAPFSQMVGALRIEYAIALLELGGERHEVPLALQIGIFAVFVGTVAFFRWYLVTLAPAPGEPTVEAGPTL